MPLLKRKPFKRNPIPEGIKDDDEVFYCEQTNEVFKNYDEFFERCMLTNSVIWQCALTGRPELTYSEALESEKTARKLLRQFPSALRGPVTYVASRTKRSALRELVDDVFNIIKDRFFKDEKVDVMNESGRGCRFCKIVEVIKPANYDATQVYDQIKLQYRVEAIDDSKEPQVWTTTGEHLRRDKTLFAKEKLKLFLKQNVEGSNAMLVVKAESIKKYVEDKNFNINENFIGKLPDFEVSKKIQLQEEKTKKKKEAKEAKDSKNGGGGKKKEKKEGKQGDITKYLNNSGGGASKKELTEEQKKEREEKSKKFREELEAKRKEKADREAERLRNLQLEKQRILAKTQAMVRELNQVRDDLELIDQRIIPKSKPISTLIEKKFFGDFIKILEFLHSFPEVLSINDKFPYGINMDLLERALILKEVNGPLSDILQVLLSTIFSLQIEEENEIDIKYLVNGDAPPRHSKIEIMKNASRIHIWIAKHFHMKINHLVMDSTTLSELLRLHLISSGAILEEKSSRARFQTRGGYRSTDDPGLSFVTKYPHIIKFLAQYSVFQLSTRDIIRTMTCLIDQILSYSNLRDIIEDRIEKAANARLEYRRMKADEKRRELKVTEEKKACYEEHKNIIAGYESEEQKVKENLIKLAEAELERKIAKIDLHSNKEHAIYLKELKAQVTIFFNYQTYLGVDRAFRNYYIFESVPGLFVEQDLTYSGRCMDEFIKNNPALAHCTQQQRYAIIKQMVTNEETGSSPGEQNKENNVDVNGTANAENKITDGVKKESDLDIQKELLMCNCDASTCAVHADTPDRTVWSYYNTEEEINALIESLNVRGFREKNLREQLEANRDLIVDYIKKCPVEKLSFASEGDNDVVSKAMRLKNVTKVYKKYEDPNFNCRTGADVNEIYDFVLRNYLLEFEHKISAGCLGEIKATDKMMWRKYIQDGEYYSLDDNLKWGRASVANGSVTNGHSKSGGSSRGSEKNDDDDATSESMSTIEDTDVVQAMEVDSGNCSDVESMDENVQMKTSDVEAVKLKVKNLAMALLQIEQGIEIKFIRAPFGPSKETKDKSAMARAYELSKKRLLMWEESLMKATNFSQVFLHYTILYDSIKWSQSAQRIGCLVCRLKSDPEQTLLCDECNKGWHMYCLKPKLTVIPTGDWFCPRCRPENYIVKRNRKRPVVVLEEDSEDEEEEVETEGSEEETENTADDTVESVLEVCSECNGESEHNELIYCEDCPVRCHYECAKPKPKSARTKKWKCQKCINKDKREERFKRRRMEKDEDDDEEESEEEEEEVPEKNTSRRRSKRAYEESDDSEVDEKTKKSNDRKSGRRSNRQSRKNSPELNVSDRQKRNSRKSVPETTTDRRASKRSFDPFNTISLGNLIDEIIKHDKAWPFIKPVSTAEVPDYLEVIKRPMDFSKIKSKLNLGGYTSNEQAMKDVQQVFFNCDLYNLSSSEIYKAGSQLEKFVAKRSKELNLPFKPSDMISS